MHDVCSPCLKTHKSGWHVGLFKTNVDLPQAAHVDCLHASTEQVRTRAPVLGFCLHYISDGWHFLKKRSISHRHGLPVDSSLTVINWWWHGWVHLPNPFSPLCAHAETQWRGLFVMCVRLPANRSAPLYLGEFHFVLCKGLIRWLQGRLPAHTSACFFFLIIKSLPGLQKLSVALNVGEDHINSKPDMPQVTL